jgi:cob(I)alamin adenosyltransferase
MKHFVLPGGHPTVSTIHVARCVCRRAERCCVKIETSDKENENFILKYLNRLSDYLFVLSRYQAHLLKAEENPWLPRL